MFTKPKNLPSGICKQCGSETSPVLIPAVLDISARWIPAPEVCGECLEKLEAEESLKRDQEAIEGSFKASRISPRFRDCRFENFQVNALNRIAYQAAVNFDPKSGQGIMFFGSYGIGKTHLATAIANRFMNKMGVLYISCPELLLEIRESINGKGKPERFSVARRAPLLILDDIGAEKPSEWVSETLFVLINHRYEYKLPTILTTNCSLDELESRLGGRIVSRIVEMCRCIKFSGKDFRLKKNLREVA